MHESRAGVTRPPIEAALRYLGARRHGSLVELIEYAIKRSDGHTAAVLAPLTMSTSLLDDWTPRERAHALWKIVEESIADPQVSAGSHSRGRRVLQAAFRLPDRDIDDEWGASLTERFRQLQSLRSIFGAATSTQPMEIAWKHGVERLSERIAERLEELLVPQDWARYKPVEPAAPDAEPPAANTHPASYDLTKFRPPSEGAQKLLVNYFALTIVMEGRNPVRRISERIITSQVDGLEYYTTRVFSSMSMLMGRTYVPTRALWGCRAEHLVENNVPTTRLWFPRPLGVGEQAHFMSEAIHEADEDDLFGWANVEVDHHGIEPGALQGGLLPVSGLTIRISFDSQFLPTAAWWYAEQNEQERYTEPPAGSPRLLTLSGGDVVKNFDQPCHPRESYGIAYKWPRNSTGGVRWPALPGR